MNNYYIVFCIVGDRYGDYFTGSCMKQAYKKAFSCFRKYMHSNGINPYITGIECHKVNTCWFNTDF